MPKYKVEWDFGGRKAQLGMLVFNDDDAAISEVTALCRQEGLGATIMRPDRKLTVAIIDRAHDS
ncbi:MAG: hypothetical protein ACK4OJ_08930 [Brevundimonas sp.]